MHCSRPSGIIATMIVGDRLRALRVEKNFSQGDMEKRTGLLRCYISRVENGHTVPNVETLEKLARALEVPLYQLFYEGKEPLEPRQLLKHKGAVKMQWGDSSKELLALKKFRRLLGQVKDEDRRLLLFMANKMAGHKTSRPRRRTKANRVSPSRRE